MYLLTGVVKGVRPTKFTPLARKIKRQTANPGLSGEMAVKTMWVTACISRGSVSVFKSVSVSRYTSRYFSSRFGVYCRFFKISRYRFGIFGISLCVKAPRADLKILLPSQSGNFDRRSVSA